MRFLLQILFIVAFSSPALAHMGHVGELAGHSHVLGWGLLIGAGIAAAAIGKLTGKKEDEEASEEDALDDELEGEAA